MNKQALIGLVILIGAGLIYLAQQGLSPQGDSIGPTGLQNDPSQKFGVNKEQSGRPEIVSSVPSLSEEPITILPTQTLELTFNQPLENIGEFKYKIEPTVEVKISLSDDRFTTKISPTVSFKLGTSYTLTVLPDSKFNVQPGNEATKKKLDRDIYLKFKILEYRGI